MTTGESFFPALAAKSDAVIGQVHIRNRGGNIVFCHRDDTGIDELRDYSAGEARDVSRFDDAGVYRPLKTAPNLRHGWRIVAKDAKEAEEVIDAIYPGRLAVLRAWQRGELFTTTWRQTLERQSGIYRIAAKISAAESDQLIGRFCRSCGGCLRTILWKQDESGITPSAALPPQKYDPAYDQMGSAEAAIPLLCQEPCNLLVDAARRTVKGLK